MRIARCALPARPGSVIARRHGAICRATRDGAVWIGQLQPLRTPGAASNAPRCSHWAMLAEALPASRTMKSRPARRVRWQEIRYEERGAVGYLHFDFYNGALDTRAMRAAAQRLCAGAAAADASHRAEGGSRFLVQRHASALHRSGR